MKHTLRVGNAMSVRKLAAGFLTAVLTTSCCASAIAQGYADAGNTRGALPPVDPLAFDPDYRWFEPVYDMDLADMKPSKRAPTGWFGTYDRLHLYGTRGDVDGTRIQGGEDKLDGGWGHRYEVGYVNPHDDDGGWWFTATEMDVDAYQSVRHESINRFVDNTTGTTTNQFGQIVPPGSDEPLNYDYDFIDESNTLNVYAYDSYEINKTWRMTPYHYGGILEPLVGMRWIRLEDYTNRFDYDPAVDLIGGVNTGVFGLQDTMTVQQSRTEHDMVMGQVGFRYTKARGRFVYSSDFRAFAGGSWQCSKSNVATTIDGYQPFDPAGPDPAVTLGNPVQSRRYDETPLVIERNEEFAIGFDVRGELGYQVTRMLQLKAGVQLIDIGSGVWRGGIFGDDQNDDLVMVGGTFGISLNH